MPEEINRVVTDSIADVFLVTEESGRTDLWRKGIAPERIHLVGKLMIDSLRQHLERARTSEIADRLGSEVSPTDWLRFTGRQALTTSIVWARSWGALSVIAESMPLLWPMHPITRSRLHSSGIELSSGIRVLEPPGYLDFLSLEADSSIMLTDSGVIQEETTALGVSCLTRGRSSVLDVVPAMVIFQDC